MDARLVEILLYSGISLTTGVFLSYLGFWSPIFRRDGEALDQGTAFVRGAFRIVGPVLCAVATTTLIIDLRAKAQTQAVNWHDIEPSGSGCRISVPEKSVVETKVNPVHAGELEFKEYCFSAQVPTL